MCTEVPALHKMLVSVFLIAYQKINTTYNLVQQDTQHAKLDQVFFSAFYFLNF